MEEKYQILLRFNAHYQTESVEVVGDFTGWQKNKIPLEKSGDGNIWKTYTELPSGEYAYHFLVDGSKSHLDPYNPILIKKDRHSYSYLIVGQAQMKNDAYHSLQDIDIFTSDTVYIKASVNKTKYSQVQLIILIHDVPQAVPGFLIYNNQVYSHYIFKFQNAFSIDNCLYYFELEKKTGGSMYFGTNGVVESEWEVASFEYKHRSIPPLQSPEWVKKSLFYQIFPDRFFNGNKKTDPENALSPDNLPSSDSYYGGDLDGIIQKIDYLKKLHINALYLNPIFEAPSPHKYDTADYKKIDPHFGTLEVFHKLIKALEENYMNLILDGVFNHTGTQFFAFKDLEKNGASSRYKDWYIVKNFPLIEKGKPNYECWWGFPSLPKLNMQNPEVKSYILEIAGNWLKRGASGWRLDIPNEIDHSFWKEFRSAVKSINPEAFLAGEIWQNGSQWLKGDEFDSVVNYRFRDACVEFFARKKMSAENFVIELGRQLFDYPMQANFVMLNLLSSHDTPRFYSIVEKDINRLKLAVAFQFTFLGIPMIYYGEENGMEGGHDPDNRRFMEWNEEKWDKDVLNFYKTMIRIRMDNHVLSDGDIRFFFSQESVIGFERFNHFDKLTIFINNSEKNIQIDLTQFLGNGDFVDISKDHPLKRKKVFTLYSNEFVILRKVKDR